METIQKYLEQDLFIEITLHYKKELYYAWGTQEREEKHFTYKIKDLVNLNRRETSKHDDRREFTPDEFTNENKYNSYDDALNNAVKECDEYLSQFDKNQHHDTFSNH